MEKMQKGVAVWVDSILPTVFSYFQRGVHLWTDMDIGFKGTAVKDAMEMFDRDVNYFRRLTRWGTPNPAAKIFLTTLV